MALSPAVEEQYKALTRDYDKAQKFYQDLLAKKSAVGDGRPTWNAASRASRCGC